MIAITGDTHGYLRRFESMGEPTIPFLGEGDYLLICGDFGYLFENNAPEHEFLDYMARLPYKILFVDGNHEGFPALNRFDIEIWNGGKVHVLRRDKTDEPKIIHLMRGQVFEIEGKAIFTMGGGFTFDKYRRREGESWWPEEMPNREEMNEAIENLKKHNYKVDIIVTHTGPEETMKKLGFYSIEEQPLTTFLEYIRDTVEYKHWYFGHLHLDEDLWRDQSVLLNEYRDIKTNEVLGVFK